MEETFQFVNRDGRKLSGIVHVPGETIPGPRIGVNLLNPGIKYRVAPNRLNVKIARRLCELGYYVLRFDPEGVGDSEGELPSGFLIPEIWEEIQNGCFVQDTRISNEEFCERYGVERLVMAGNCGGAITALLSSANDKRVAGFCLIDIPVDLRTASMNFADKIASGGAKVDKYFSEYVNKLFDLKGWYRFVTFQSEYRAIYKVFRMKIAKIFPWLQRSVESSYIQKMCEDNKLNPLFFDRIDDVIKHCIPTLFILAGNDSGSEIFQQYFQNTYLQKKRYRMKNNDFINIFLIDGANHVYSKKEWQDQLIDRITQWVDQIR